MKIIKRITLLLLIFILVGCNNWALDKEQYKGKKLAVIVKVDNKLDIGLRKEVGGIGEELDKEEIKEVNDFFKDKLKAHTKMVIVNQENVLDNNKNYQAEAIQKNIKKKYDAHFLFVASLSNIIFNFNEDPNNLFDESYRDSGSDIFEHSKEEEIERYEYGCSVTVTYQLIDLFHNRPIYSGQGSTYYKTGNNYGSKVTLLEEAIIEALEETELID